MRNAGVLRMAKRNTGATRRHAAIKTDRPAATTPDAVETRVVAFAEQLGRIVGTVQARAEGWLDREALKQDIVAVRDGAADVLERLTAGDAAKTGPKKPATSPRSLQGRSGGVVDAPGKKHRKPMPADPRARRAHKQVRAAPATRNSSRRRGRG